MQVDIFCFVCGQKEQASLANEWPLWKQWMYEIHIIFHAIGRAKFLFCSHSYSVKLCRNPRKPSHASTFLYKKETFCEILWNSHSWQKKKLCLLWFTTISDVMMGEDSDFQAHTKSFWFFRMSRNVYFWCLHTTWWIAIENFLLLLLCVSFWQLQKFKQLQMQNKCALLVLFVSVLKVLQSDFTLDQINLNLLDKGPKIWHKYVAKLAFNSLEKSFARNCKRRFIP